jgi:hydroxymethylpyrimidine/phosphomethylpyrimidine kinase
LPRLDHGRDTLRVLGVSKRVQLEVGHLFHANLPVQQGRFERLPAGGSFQRRRHSNTSNAYVGRNRFLNETHPFRKRQAASLASTASMQIPDQRLEGTTHADAHPMKIALTIAGSDSGGGAGIQADLKTFHQFGVFGTSVVVALTAQNTLGVRAVETVPESMISAQLTALAEDLPPAALKTGMLAEPAVVRQVARAIRENGWAPLVVDPVMVSTSGARLLTSEAEDVIRDDLLPLAALITPNIDEAAILTGRVVHDVPTMERAAATLLRFGAAAALVKGGHLSTGEVTDVLATSSGTHRFTHSRIETTSTHGTGCTLSAAITAGLALGRPLEEAIATGLDFVHRAIAAAPNLGAGHGPLNHTVPATTDAR